MASVTCSRCGKQKFVNPKALEVRLAKYGSLEKIAESWVCRECAAKDKFDFSDESTVPVRDESNEPTVPVRDEKGRFIKNTENS